MSGFDGLPGAADDLAISPRGMTANAILWPAGIGSRAISVWPSTFSSLPADSGTRAMATLSEACKWMTEFSAVGSFAISSSVSGMMITS
jgi:hypothetical protein